ncbi:hypothetical protein SAMN02910447_03267 [Ruminococcus sp. YE71]|uniref:hypothetical protein n=1 Tax=unclassified Ruminococcus TaxID=2608920 RepID=UPI00088E61F9|nr:MULTISPECIES: hypothetical protein [unclassified Ruminococcus]SDA30813.1 hypothetical protein SAMN02910446_03337 [Ruminococcus sp. YE78]SFW50515.1 hypothetical protein SAMN02910447_03267 [Ruminococcus sp. YE71]
MEECNNIHPFDNMEKHSENVKMKKLYDSKSRLYIWIVFLTPFLSVYGLKSLGLDFGTLSLIIAFMVMCIKKKLAINFPKFDLWGVYIVYLLLGIVLYEINIIPSFVSSTSIITRAGKYILLILILLFSIKNDFFEYEYVISVYIKLSLLACMFILVQTIAFYLFGRIIHGYLPFFLYAETYESQLTVGIGTLYRPTSFFYEPSHFSQYCGMALPIILFKYGETDKRKYWYAIIVTLSIIASTSGMGIFLAGLVWIIWMMTESNIINRTLNVKKIILATIIISVSYLFVVSDYGNKVTSRLIGKNTGLSAFDARTGSFEDIVQMDFWSLLFGNCYGNVIENKYMTSWIFNIWCLGIVGSLIILFLYFFCFKDAYRKEIKIIVLINIISSFLGTTFMGVYFLIYFFVILSGNKKVNEKYEKSLYHNYS